MTGHDVQPRDTMLIGHTKYIRQQHNNLKVQSCSTEIKIIYFVDVNLHYMDKGFGTATRYTYTYDTHIHSNSVE